MTVRVCGRLCKRHGPQKMVATRSSALQENLPRTLHIPHESFTQFSLFLHTHPGELFHENVALHWRAENLDALWILDVRAKVLHLGRTNHRFVPRPCLARV